MPELPDITVYIEALDRRVTGQPVEAVCASSPFVVRSYDPPIRTLEGATVLGLRRLGKQVVFALDGELFLVLHLMIAGRLRWHTRGAKAGAKSGLATFDFPTGTLVLTEASTKQRASLHLVRGEQALVAFDRGGLEVMTCSLRDFADRLAAENHTLKRALTDPDIFSGIGNAYSDEILHRARLSPFKQTRALTEADVERLRAEAGEGFPEKVTAFRPKMAVHGRYRLPCPDCGTPVQRIVHGEHETNYCPDCQTGGRLLADRALSRLLKQDWPGSLDQLESRQATRRAAVALARATAPVSQDTG